MTREEIQIQIDAMFNECRDDRDGNRLLDLLENYFRTIIDQEREPLILILSDWLSKGWGPLTDYALWLVFAIKIEELRNTVISLMKEWLLSLRQPKIGLAIDEIERMLLIELSPELKIARASLINEAETFPKDSLEYIWRSNVSKYISNAIDKLNSNRAT